MRLPTLPSAVTLVALSLAVGATQASKLDDAVYYREGVMNILAWNTDQMAAMVKGEVAFDRTVFQGLAADLASAATLNILPGFPEGSTSDDSDARDEIWLNWPDFESKLQQLRTESAKLAKVAEDGDQAAIKSQLDATRRTCKSCHDDYKQ